MIVEKLRFEVPAEALEAFLTRDHDVWTAFLAGCAGFVDKQVWINDYESTVVMIIRWTSRQLWKSVDAATVARVDGDMGEFSFAPTCTEYRVWTPTVR